MSCVLQDWVCELPLKQQTVLIVSLRGCDGKSKNDPTKFIVRELRKVVLRNADESSLFMKTDTLDVLDGMIGEFLDDLDSYPIHFALHLCHAAEIVGYKHPDLETRDYWNDFYSCFCNTFHMNNESIDEFDKRLTDNLCKKI